MLIKDLMSHAIVTVELDDDLSMIKEIFDEVSFHHLLVVENNKLFGILSDRDLFKALSPNIGSWLETDRDLATLNKKVHHIMTRKPITLTANDDIYDAITLFNQENISCIPIVEGKKPIGILSWHDLMRFLVTLKRT